EPFRYARQLGVNPLAVVGNVQTRLGIRFRLDEIINFEDVALTANAEIADLDWKKGVFGLDVSRGAFKLSLDNKGMELAGNAQLSDSPAVISWRENFGDKVGFRRQLKISTPVTATTLKNLGLEISSFITGQLAAVVNVTGYDNGVNNIDGVFDLRDAAFTTPLLQLTKRPGQPGQATATIQLRNHRVAAISKLSVDTGELKVTGSLTFHPDGQTMKDIEITRLVAGRTDISAKLVGDRTGAKRGTISGTSLDLVPILAKRSDSGDFLLTPIDIAGSIGTLHFSRDRSVTNFQGDAQFDGKSWRRIRLDALAEGKKVQIALIPDAQGRALTVRADDAGAAFRSLNVIDTIRGGRITISARGVDGPQGATFRGRAEMLNFRIVRAPVMARIMALASFSGIGNLLATDQGVEFQEFSAPFSMANGIISVTNARAIGSQIGITASGSLDFPKDRADLRGTVVPAYTLNSIVGKIPLIGDVLVGERNSGLLAATYSVRGPLSNPELNVNPLTMLTPGFLRNITEIFEGRSGEVENPPAPQFDPNGPSRETR
ncbi:MAG: AsmA-like C-terminal domain-containing protein, partial [Alphaproteobacteria bacterium]